MALLGRGRALQGPAKERWQELCEQAVVEQDPERLTTLIEEINRLLEEKEQRLMKQRQASASG